MLDGNTFLPVTGMPMRKMACMSSPFALADPVPLTVPILNAKSLMGIWNQKFELAHVPRRRRAALGAEATVEADVLVFHHDPLRLRKRRRGIDVLRHVRRRRREVLADVRVRLVLRDDREAILRTHVDAGVALDAEACREIRLDVAIEAALDLGRRLLGV